MLRWKAGSSAEDNETGNPSLADPTRSADNVHSLKNGKSAEGQVPGKKLDESVRGWSL